MTLVIRTIMIALLDVTKNNIMIYMIIVDLHFTVGLYHVMVSMVSNNGKIVSNRVVIRVRRKWKCSDSSNSDSVALVTPLTTPIFYFHKVISTLTTPLMIPTLTLWLVKTSL